MITVVIPTYNEAPNLTKLIDELFSLNIKNLNLIIIDDASPDGSALIAKQLAKKYVGNIKVIERHKKLGLGTAYIIGFIEALKAGAKRIIQMDADLSHSPKYIPVFLEILEEYDVVIGSRYVKQGSYDPSYIYHRKLLSLIGNIYIKLVTRISIKDATSGFKGFTRAAIESLNLSQFQCIGYAFQVEMAYKCHQKELKVFEYPIKFLPRAEGNSKMSIQIVIEALFKILLIRLRS